MKDLNWLQQTMNCLLFIREQSTFKDLQALDKSCIESMKRFAYADEVHLVKKEDALVCSIHQYKDDLPRTEYVDNKLIEALFVENKIAILDKQIQPEVQKIVGTVGMVTVIPVNNTFFHGAVILSYHHPFPHSDKYLHFIQVCQMETKHLYEAFYAREKLKQFQARFDGMLQTVSQSIVFIDSNGAYCWVNNNAAKLLNIIEEHPRPDQVRAAMMLLKDRAENAADINDPGSDIFSGKARQVFYWKFAEPDVKVLKVTFMMINAEASNGVMWVFDDVTKEHMYERALEDLNKQLAIQSRRTEESNKRYQYVSKASSEAIWDWDLIQSTVYWGEGIETTFGYNLLELTHRVESWLNNVHPEDGARVWEEVQAALNSDSVHWVGEYRFRKANGTYAFVVDKCFIIRDKNGKAIRVVGAMQDISERVQSVIEAKAFAEDLYKRNNELQQFGYIVSHNLRAPVANIIGITSLLEMDCSDTNTVLACTRRLKAAVGNLDEVLQDLSKILSLGDASASMPKEMVNLNEVLNNVKGDLSELINYNQAKIYSPRKQYRFFTHKAYVYSVFYNLISNAIKYRSERRPEIHIKISLREDHYIAEISDNGIGIDLSKHGEELCQPYKRFNTTVDGKGLGLFLVKSHVEAINGRLSIESTPGKGTSFIIAIPAS